MNQLSIIYLIMGSVLLVGVMLISISPNTTPAVNQNGEALAGFSHINTRTAIAPGFEKIPLYFTPDQGQLHDKVKLYASISTYTTYTTYTLGMTSEGLVGDIIRKVGGEGIDTPRPFLMPGY